MKLKEVWWMAIKIASCGVATSASNPKFPFTGPPANPLLQDLPSAPLVPMEVRSPLRPTPEPQSQAQTFSGYPKLCRWEEALAAGQPPLFLQPQWHLMRPLWLLFQFPPCLPLPGVVSTRTPLSRAPGSPCLLSAHIFSHLP